MPDTVVLNSSVLVTLRALSPAGPLTRAKAETIAEHQAVLALDLNGVTEPPISTRLLASICPRVEYRRGWPLSGSTIRCGGSWRVVISADEPEQRQRFTLAHELKHIIDDPTIERTLANTPVHRRIDQAEWLCNRFAACLLMPRPWIVHDFYGGLQDVRELALRYEVSEEAMSNRLSELGLIDAPWRSSAGRYRRARRARSDLKGNANKESI